MIKSEGEIFIQEKVQSFYILPTFQIFISYLAKFNAHYLTSSQVTFSLLVQPSSWVVFQPRSQDSYLYYSNYFYFVNYLLHIFSSIRDRNTLFICQPVKPNKVLCTQQVYRHKVCLVAAQNKWARFYFIFQNSEKKSNTKRRKTKTDQCRLNTKNHSISSPLKKLKFQNKYQCEEHDQISNNGIQKHIVQLQRTLQNVPPKAHYSNFY